MEGFHNVCLHPCPAGALQPLTALACARHDGLTRGVSHLRSCETGEIDCKNRNPRLVHYDGYKSFSEPVSQIVSCIGPRGVPLNESDEDAIWAYPGRANGKTNPTPDIDGRSPNHVQVLSTRPLAPTTLRDSTATSPLTALAVSRHMVWTSGTPWTWRR